ncbi:PREDICTED: uncharacterized protein LOC107071044 [Polistes dominula]|uniref:Uncharacterized protein LOC107071044 n=1 Tax=Polistes dominula TaxID=743375 RepID=A0ABM1IY98_POLDO|nr:PREDICTED: uncharacterized protein LOC107071044 [Polistes dominula]
MWMLIISGLEMFVSAYAVDNKVVSDNIDNMEENQGGFPEGKLPSPQQLLEMLDSMTGISEEEKNNLREDLMKTIEGRGADFQQMSATRDLTGQTLILLSLLAIVALIFVFFVYKLFKCLKEREQKKEEKKKNKQSKKKK